MNLKRIISLVLALTMIFTLAFPGGIAFADDEDIALLEEDTEPSNTVGSGNDNDDPAVELIDPDDDLEQEENTAQQPDAVSEDEMQQPDTPAEQQDGQAEDKAEQTGDSAEEDQSVLLSMSVVHDPLKAPESVKVAQIMYVEGTYAGQAVEGFTDLATALQEAGGDHVEGEINYGILSTEVTLLASPVSIDGSVALRQDVVLDLNDKTLTLGDNLALPGGSLTIRGTGMLEGYNADAPQVSFADGYYYENGAVKRGDQYTVTFDSAGGSPVPTQFVVSNRKATRPADPDRPGYTFDGWYDGSLPWNFDTLIAENKTLTAHWTVNEYAISYDLDGGALGEGISNPTGYTVESAFKLYNPTKEGYTFAGWTGTGLTEATTSVSVAAGNTGERSYTATWTANAYSITWNNDDGTKIDTTTVNYGEMPTHADAVKAPNAQYTYIFAGWTPAIEAVSGEATYTATYTDIVNEYMVKFINEDGTELQSGKVAYGETPAYTGERPEKEATAQYSYTFKGWTPAIEAVTGDVTYTAAYDSTANKYTIRFVNEGDTELQSKEVAYGETPTYTGATPTKQGDAQYSYTFAGWNPEIAAVTGEATYTATYTDIVNEYTAKFVDADGTELHSTEVEYGTLLTAPEEPTREGFKFIGWTLDGETYDFKTPVTANITLTAVYEEIPYVVGRYALQLDNSFAINYYVDDLREGTNPADYTVSFNGGDEYTLTSSKRNEFKNVARVFANELLKEVSVVVKYKGEVVYEDAPSVRGYCDKVFAKYGHDQDVQLVLICEAALNYGSKAQQFAGDTGRLANDGEWFVAPGVDVPQASGYESGAATGITVGRSALTMGSTISLNLYAQHGRKALKSNYSFLVDGVRIDNEDVTDANNLYGVVIQDLFVTALDVEHSLTVIYHEGQSDQETFSYTISPNAYLYKANTASANQVMRELAYYLYNYYAATTIPNVM